MIYDPITGLILAVLHLPVIVGLFVARDMLRRRWPLP